MDPFYGNHFVLSFIFNWKREMKNNLSGKGKYTDKTNRILDFVGL